MSNDVNMYDISTHISAHTHTHIHLSLSIAAHKQITACICGNIELSDI